MKLSRRDLLKLGAYTGAIVISSGLQGCADDDDTSSNPNPDANNDLTPVSYAFKHGIASGDPLANSVILWTRLDASEVGAHNVSWEVATDSAFLNLINQDSSSVTADTDYTLKVEVQNLNAGTTYYYRFKAGSGDQQVMSATGTTRTLPTGQLNALKLAVFSCANYPAGHFHVYAEAAKNSGIEFALHLGDYLYEYGQTDSAGNAAYASADAASLGRLVTPNHELLKLDDYRTRYAQYRTDTDLQDFHAKLPFIPVWDDHEIANDAFQDGAENHDPATEGDFASRKQDAIKAYFEWMPIRPLTPDTDGRIYRQFEFGDLVNLMMLDTRIIGRVEPLNYVNYINPSDGSFDAAKFTAEVSSAAQTILGTTQRSWLETQMGASSATWQVLGQQVLMMRMNLPAVTLTPDPANPTVSLFEYGDIATAAGTYDYMINTLGVADDDALLLAAGMTQAQIDIVRDPVKMAYLQSPSIPYNLDAWDGYAADREQLLGTAKALGKNLVSLAGDTHNAWSGYLTDFGGDTVGVEFATCSVSSPGLEEYLALPDAAAARAAESGILQLVNDLQYCNVRERGYMLLNFEPTQVQAEWVFIDSIKNTAYQIENSLAKTLNYDPTTKTLS